MSAPAGSLSLLMEDGHAVLLTQDEVERMLAEIAGTAPEMLHRALEQRIVSLIAEIRGTMTEGS